MRRRKAGARHQMGGEMQRFQGVAGPACQTAEAARVTHLPLTKPATFRISILKVFLPERTSYLSSCCLALWEKSPFCYGSGSWGTVGRDGFHRCRVISDTQPLSPARLCPCTLRGDDAPGTALLPRGTAGCPRGDCSLLAGRVRLTGSPMHTQFPALPPSPPSPWKVHDRLDIFSHVQKCILA